MRIKMTTRNDMELSQSVENYVFKKVGKLDRYFDDNIEATVRMGVIKNRFICEITIPLQGEILRAEESTNDMYISIDSALSKLEGQIRKYRTRISKRMKSNADPIEVFDLAEAPAAQVVRTKRFKVASMDVDEAISQMEMLGHSFFIYVDEKTGDTQVVYRREDGNYGVLIPE